MGKKPANFNQITLQWMREELGCLHAETVEVWNGYGRNKRDLFNFADYLGYTQKETILVQATSRSNIRSREKKVLASEAARDWVQSKARLIYVVGWDKKDGAYRHRVLQVAQEDFGG